MSPDAAEATYLRRLIETQPVCLLRVRRDDVVLACNNAGLSLLGREQLAEVLDQTIVVHIAPECHEAWVEFTDRVWTHGAGSLECRLAQQSDDSRTVLFHATALRDHPDGHESLLVAARDTTAVRRLEQEVENAEVAAQARLKDAGDRMAVLELECARAAEENTRLIDDKVRLQSHVDEAGRERQRRDAEYLAALSQLRQDLERARQEAEHHKAVAIEEAALAASSRRDLASEVRDQEHEERIATLQAAVELATADHQRAQTLLARAEAEQQRMVAGHAADRAEAQRTLGEAIFKRNEALKSLADQRIELQQWSDQACALEPLAAAGRLAIDVARELQTILATIDERAQFLLGLVNLEASYRPEVEGLRAEAIRAESLARQLTASRTDRGDGDVSELDAIDDGPRNAEGTP